MNYEHACKRGEKRQKRQTARIFDDVKKQKYHTSEAQISEDLKLNLQEKMICTIAFSICKLHAW